MSFGKNIGTSFKKFEQSEEEAQYIRRNLVRDFQDFCAQIEAKIQNAAEVASDLQDSIQAAQEKIYTQNPDKIEEAKDIFI